MPNFTSALYLGLRHPTRSLRPWSQISPGVPAAFSEPSSADITAAKLAALQGCETGVLASSTLHLFWDLFGLCVRKPVQVFFDAKLYTIGRWGVERAQALGAPSHRYRHMDPADLNKKLRDCHNAGPKPIIVTDGFCPDCGRTAPLRQYAQIVEEYGGLLVVDDTQALGIFGHSPDPGAPYGNGGGGTLRWLGIESRSIVLICSLAKAFGVPIAVLAGSENTVRRFKKGSLTRIHCSPPSIAAIHAQNTRWRSTTCAAMNCDPNLSIWSTGSETVRQIPVSLSRGESFPFRMWQRVT
jgi:8-amino-7-oxononanoate synthase